MAIPSVSRWHGMGVCDAFCHFWAGLIPALCVRARVCFFVVAACICEHYFPAEDSVLSSLF